MIVLRPEFCLVCSQVKDCDTPLFQEQRESQIFLYVLFPKELRQYYSMFSFFFSKLKYLHVLTLISVTVASPHGARSICQQHGAPGYL